MFLDNNDIVASINHDARSALPSSSRLDRHALAGFDPGAPRAPTMLPYYVCIRGALNTATAEADNFEDAGRHALCKALNHAAERVVDRIAYRAAHGFTTRSGPLAGVTLLPSGTFAFQAALLNATVAKPGMAIDAMPERAVAARVLVPAARIMATRDPARIRIVRCKGSPSVSLAHWQALRYLAAGHEAASPTSMMPAGHPRAVVVLPWPDPDDIAAVEASLDPALSRDAAYGRVRAGIVFDKPLYFSSKRKYNNHRAREEHYKWQKRPWLAYDDASGAWSMLPDASGASSSAS